MSTSVASITPQSAPRDAQGLAKLGIFQLRLLIEKLGYLKTEQEKVAFAKMDTDSKIKLALDLLSKFDAGGGGAVVNGTTPGVGAMPAPPQMPAPMTQVDPAAMAAAAAAAAPPPTVSRRSPKTAADVAQPPPAADLGADVINLLNKIVQQNDELQTAVLGSLKEVLGNTNEVAKSNQQLASNYGAVYNALQSIDKALQQTALTSKLAIALVLPLAEQVLGASREDIIGAALGDADTVQALVAEISKPGKT